MPDHFKKPSFNNRRPSFGAKRPGAFRPQGELHDADCNSCGKPCQVPFRPNGKKPVYCRDCFQPSEDRAPFQKPRREFAPRPAGDPRIDSILTELKTLTQSVEKLSTELHKLTQSSELRTEVLKLVPAAEKKTKKATTKAASKVSKKK